jgi:hypothetical protein
MSTIYEYYELPVTVECNCGQIAKRTIKNEARAYYKCPDCESIADFKAKWYLENWATGEEEGEQ